ncbi:alpha/beta fold hydrolase [Virgibacillus soli]|uniref:alpha/beta fold hydrolase n=1 Tax=Paracerasibacillus soli TaxID=480284 RepID=UPI0035F0C7C9
MWEQCLIKTERGRFEYFKKGTGDPLCVTHLYSEFNTNGNIFALPFTKHNTVFLVNLRGCGKSDNTSNPHDYSMDTAVKDLEAIRKALGFEKWGFAGHSTGGMLALKYAILAKERLTKIIAGGLCASAEYMRHPKSIYCKENPNHARVLEIIRLLGLNDTPLEERRALNKEWALMSIYDKSLYNDIVSRANSGKVVSARLDYFSYTELIDFDLRPLLPNVNVPAFIYCGRHDAQCPYVFSREAAMLMPNATMTTFEESNHNPFVEEEKEFERFVEYIAAN